MCKVVYEDNHLLIVEKPPNLLTQGDITGDDCLIDHMKRYVKQKYQKPGEVYLGCVHRLDRPVGGLVALARTSKAAARLSEQLRTHAMRRDYLVVATGADIVPTGTLSDWLLKDEQTGSVACVSPYTPEAQQAKLRWQTLAADAQTDTALLAIALETGRKHQIRVQLAHAGHPIVQDMRYGKGEPGEPIALWGAALTLMHPTTRATMTFVSRPQGKAFVQYADVIDAFLLARSKGSPGEQED
ncbi:MAG: RluA family pseudouridine synthase [Eubacteriales bacterium]|nr:RluA family pseudouridine synthase [Eubacteriales bacterium]